MRRNFNNRMETVAPVTNPAIQAELKPILGVYEGDNASAWDMQPDGHYVRRRPEAGQPRRDVPAALHPTRYRGPLSSSGEKAGHDQD